MDSDCGLAGCWNKQYDSMLHCDVQVLCGTYASPKRSDADLWAVHVPSPLQEDEAFMIYTNNSNFCLLWEWPLPDESCSFTGSWAHAMIPASDFNALLPEVNFLSQH